MAGVLVDLSDEFEIIFQDIVADSVLKTSIDELSLYETKEPSEILRKAGFLNIIFRSEASLKARSISLAEMRATDLGLGYNGEKKEVVTSEVVAISETQQGLCLFHWDGFTSLFQLAPFHLIDQRFDK